MKKFLLYFINHFSDMKTKIITFLLVLCATAVTAKTHKSSSVVSLDPFKSVFVIGNKNTEVILSQESQCQLEIEGCAVNDVKIETSDSILLISTMHLDSVMPIQLRISSPAYEQLHCSFVRMLISKDTLKSEELSVSAACTNINLSISANFLQLKFLEGTSATLAGRCNNADLTCYGFNRNGRYIFDANQLLVNNMHIDCGVLSDIRINVTDSLWISDGIDSKVDVLGSPVIPENKLKWSELYLHYKR